MADLATMRILEFRISDVPNLDHARLDVDDSCDSYSSNNSSLTP